MVNFPTWIHDCDPHGPALYDFFLSFDTSINSTVAFSSLENSDHVAASVSIAFPSKSKGDEIDFPLISQFFYYPCAKWDSLWDHLRDVPWEDTFKLRVSAAAAEFCEWVQVGINVYILRRKYQVNNLHSFPLLSAACAAATTHKNYFFCF